MIRRIIRVRHNDYVVLSRLGAKGIIADNDLGNDDNLSAADLKLFNQEPVARFCGFKLYCSGGLDRAGGQVPAAVAPGQ